MRTYLYSISCSSFILLLFLAAFPSGSGAGTSLNCWCLSINFFFYKLINTRFSLFSSSSWVFTQSVSFFSPSRLFLEGSNLSQLLSVSCHAVCCVYVWVCQAAQLHKLLYQPAGTLLSRLLLSLFIFPILSHSGPHIAPDLSHSLCVSFSHTFLFST